jgi:hypothetical protein
MDDLFQSFFNASVEANPTVKKSDIQKHVVSKWKELKSQEDATTAIKQEIERLKAVKMKKIGNRKAFWGSFLSGSSKQTSKESTNSPTPSEKCGSNASTISPSPMITGVTTCRPVSSSGTSSSVPSTSQQSSGDSSMAETLECSRLTPAQSKIRAELNDVNEKIAILTSAPLHELTKDCLTQLKTKREELSKRLKTLSINQKANQRYRQKRKSEWNNMVETDSSNTAIKKIRPSPGRPSKEDYFPELHEVILQLVNRNLTGADERRRIESLRVCMTLDDLTEQLREFNITLSRSAVYLRLLPRDASTNEGKKHHKCLPVKLLRPQNSAHREHEDGHFAATTISHLKDLCVLFGGQAVCFLSQDDKARVPLALPAASKQAPILMNVQYRVKLPDHDWMVGPRHKFIPSVYAFCEIKETVSYSGPTFIAIRSGKHDSSTAASHAFDFCRMTELEYLKDFLRVPEGQLKPILVVTVDGGPDENPRFAKTLAAWASHFRAYDLDALFLASYAPGQSAFNVVERRMAPLSHDLSGLILRHDRCGTHLNEKGETIDIELEKKNFNVAGNELASVWSQSMIDNYPVAAEYVDPDTEKTNYQLPSEEWMAEHCRQSHYCLQIVRCENRKCCSSWRTNYPKLITNRFLSGPLPRIKTERGPEVVASFVTSGVKAGGLTDQLLVEKLLPPYPFDKFCPSLAKTNHSDFCCSVCGIYFARKTAMRSHKKALHGDASLPPESAIDDDPDNTSCTKEGNDSLPMTIYRNIFDFLQPEFEQIA